jgi:photosystem II stability/assembly factor-like uncharacterized protein
MSAAAAVAASLAALLATAPPPALVAIPLPRHAIVSNNDDIAARGRCAIVAVLDLRFMAVTSDEGRTWRFSPLTPDLGWPERGLYCDSDTFLIVGAHGDVMRLTDGDWSIVLSPSPLAAGARESSYRGLESFGGRLYLGSHRRTWISSDRGATWRPWLAGVGGLATDGKTLFVAIGRQLRKLRDARGDSTETTVVGELPARITALGFDAGTLYAATESGLHRSRDGGATWSEIPPSPAPHPDPPTAFTFANGAVFVHTDGYAVRVLLPGDQWKAHDEWRAVLPSATGFWLSLSGSIAHVRSLDEKPQRYSWPDNPFPTIRSVAASGATVVATVNSTDAIFASGDAGATWQRICPGFTSITNTVALDGDRLQIVSEYSEGKAPCAAPGLKTRVVEALPQETCNGPLCVRWRDGRLLRSRNRGQTWDDVGGKLPRDVKEDMIAAAAAGREILVGVKHRPIPVEHPRAIELWRSTDDGATYARVDLPEIATAFSPGRDGWYIGTAFHGLQRLAFGP